MSLPYRSGQPPAAREDPSKAAPPPRREPPPDWLMVTLVVCVVLILSGLFLLSDRRQSMAADTTPAPTPTAAPTPTPTPEPTPTPKASYDWSQPVPVGESADPETWFQDAVFIGDSRIDGLHSFSGIQGGAFLTHTGLTIYEVEEGEEVIRQGEKKVSLLEALAQKTCGKIYISLGVNELGYFNAQGFGETYGKVIDRIRESQPDAAIYVQAIIPVNTQKCEDHDQPYYITNQAILSYNEALADMAAQKKVFFLAPPEALLGEDGETSADYSSDGVHFKKEGYKLWLEDLLAHTVDPEAYNKEDH